MPPKAFVSSLLDQKLQEIVVEVTSALPPSLVGHVVHAGEQNESKICCISNSKLWRLLLEDRRSSEQ
jgi:peptide methionine sulfoxide reductase MsrB